jgi:hypothetical protein
MKDMTLRRNIAVLVLAAFAKDGGVERYVVSLRRFYSPSCLHEVKAITR